jgi:hypothetical protein
LSHLAFLLPPEFKEPIPDLNAAADMDVMAISPDKFIPRKRRAVMVKEQLDDIFLRRSKRTALKLHGFKKLSIHSHTCVHNTHRTLHTHIPHTRTHVLMQRAHTNGKGRCSMTGEGDGGARPAGARAG